MTDVSLDNLIRHCQRRAAADEGFINSMAHLGLLQAYAEDRAPGVRVGWADSSYSERTADGVLIRIKHPSIYATGSTDDRVLLAVQYLVHEIHHALYSDHAALAAFEARKITAATAHDGEQINVDWVIDLCNQLEDARLLEQARRQDPDDVAHLEAVHRRGFAKSLSNYEEAYGEPWGLSPTNSGEQLSLALSALILLSERFQVSDGNATAIGKMSSHVEAARRGTTSDVIRATDAIEAIIVRTQTRD